MPTPKAQRLRIALRDLGKGLAAPNGIALFHRHAR
jgi:hypothetical protein